MFKYRIIDRWLTLLIVAATYFLLYIIGGISKEVYVSLTGSIIPMAILIFFRENNFKVKFEKKWFSLSFIATIIDIGIMILPIFTGVLLVSIFNNIAIIRFCMILGGSYFLFRNVLFQSCGFRIIGLSYTPKKSYVFFSLKILIMNIALILPAISAFIRMSFNLEGIQVVTGILDLIFIVDFVFLFIGKKNCRLLSFLMGVITYTRD